MLERWAPEGGEAWVHADGVLFQKQWDPLQDSSREMASMDQKQAAGKVDQHRVWQRDQLRGYYKASDSLEV